ncbi:MAG: aminotransferase class IV [Bacteroidales bacterium]
MKECFGNFFILNGVIESTTSFNTPLVYEGESVYEVLRVSNGIPLFFNDHIDRLFSSARFQDMEILLSAREIKTSLNMLSAYTPLTEVNLKIVMNKTAGNLNWLMYFVKPSYPSEEEYENGVDAILFSAERINPESKIINNTLRSEIFRHLIEENAYEALLVDKSDCITEGSRSNVFFISDNCLFTTPGEMVLGGITRKYIIEICMKEGIPLRYERVKADKLDSFDSAVMTGTSPVVLPFRRIGDVHYNVKHPLIGFLRTRYMELAEKSMQDYKRPD